MINSSTFKNIIINLSNLHWITYFDKIHGSYINITHVHKIKKAYHPQNIETNKMRRLDIQISIAFKYKKYKQLNVDYRIFILEDKLKNNLWCIFLVAVNISCIKHLLVTIGGTTFGL